MNWLIAFFQKVFCQHNDTTHIRNIYGDEINLYQARSIWKCNECGARRYEQHLHPESKTVA